MSISAGVLTRRLIRKPLATDWSAAFEIGVLFWRGQFTRAMNMRDMDDGRTLFDSLQTNTSEDFDVSRTATTPPDPRGEWIVPKDLTSDITLLYLHGGGYTFHGGITHRFAEMLSAHLACRLFALDYRLTPENRHPAQQEDALAACRYLFESGVSPRELVIVGDSAGGHLTLMTLGALKEAGLPQPALAIGLCPWTDVNARGGSLFANDSYDLVQGWMALRFGDWLVGSAKRPHPDSLSPIHRNYAGLAPLYLQAGGREVLVDMIRDFASVLVEQGHDVTLDVWPSMTHVFQAHGNTLPDSAEAIGRIRMAIRHYADSGRAAVPFPTSVRTEIRNAAPDRATPA
jgi:acetyl esterase/lipase